MDWNSFIILLVFQTKFIKKITLSLVFQWSCMSLVVPCYNIARSTGCCWKPSGCFFCFIIGSGMKIRLQLMNNFFKESFRLYISDIKNIQPPYKLVFTSEERGRIGIQIFTIFGYVMTQKGSFLNFAFNIKQIH